MWNQVKSRLIDSRSYWISLCDRTSRPYTRPVWGVWQYSAFWYSTGSRAIRTLEVNTGASLHLESADDVVIVEGTTRVVSETALMQQFVDAYNEKYSWALRILAPGVADEYGASGKVVVVEADRIYAWQASDLQTATCWEFSI